MNQRQNARNAGRPRPAPQNGARPAPRQSARQVALDALLRIDHDGAYANILLPSMLDRSSLHEQDRRFVTELVYGTTRMRRACEALVERFVMTEPDPEVRTLLRLGAYQLAFAGVAPHAAVGETVELAHPKVRGFVNAVLRKVANTPMIWSDDADRLSYPDWILDRFVAELGEFEGLAALECMNEAPQVTTRDDGYIQDLGSQWVADLVGARPGEQVLDVCAAPGGKATSMVGDGAFVVAADLQPHRATLVRANAHRLGQHLPVVVADGTAPPFAARSFDRVLLDAPCSGLGSLRRRPDARWRITADDIVELVALQAHLLEAAAPLVKPGGTLVYSVCTITAAESIDHAVPAGFDVVTDPPDDPWHPFGNGFRLLPQDADTDGMTIVRYRARS
ncbi:MAG: putative rRNA methyltransferase [Ilumatobacteraceae bacterium]|nr:putative rRNA methyltransferase [Ilumatobacteraceae bacterium]